MPFLENSDYKKPLWMWNRHMETIVPAIFRKLILPAAPERVRIETPDRDFLDLDWYKNDSPDLVIISHGLEGDSKRQYVLGMTKHFHQNGWNVMAWNFRGCGGEMNKTSKFYHSGATYDLDTVASFALDQGFERIALIGFSLGGNLTLKYIGEYDLDKKVKSAAVFSVPLDLAGSSAEIDKPNNFLYSRRFLKSLKKKVFEKSKIMPEIFNLEEIKGLKSIYDFDDVVTARLHGFDSADHYYTACSSINFIANIKIPALVVNAANDPFLSASCFDTTNFESSDNVYFEMPKFGGHVGFSTFANGKVFWSETRALDFISQY